MINPPKTLEEAKKLRYSVWAGNPNGRPFEPMHCAYEQYEGFSHKFHQCTRQPGKGPGGLYCGTHANVIARHSKMKGEADVP